MNVKFVIVYEDNTTFESHDEMYNLKRDHSEALAPHNTKPWKEYHIVSDEGHVITVNFHTGCFTFNGVEVQPQNELGEVLTFDTVPQTYAEASDAWGINNGLEYFPAVGRRQYRGDLYGKPIYATVHYCGWKRKFRDKEIIKQAFLWPNGKFSIS